MGHFVACLPTVHDIQSKLTQGSARFPLSEVWDTLSLIRACFRALNGALGFTNESATDAQVQRMFTVIRPSVDALVTWCDFVARNSGLVFPDRAKDYGNHCACQCLKLLLAKGAPFLEETDILEKIVDIILWIWIYGANPYEKSNSVLNLDDYEERASRRNGALSMALSEDQPIRDITLRKIDALSRRSRKRLANVFCRRVLEWAAVHECVYQRSPTTFDGRYFTYICVLAQELALVESFCRTLTDCNLWDLLVATALNFRKAPAPTTAQDSKRGSLATELAFYIFKPDSFNAHDILHIIPQCLDAGVLLIIVGDLLHSQDHSRHGTARPPRFHWGDKDRPRNPFRQIHSISHYPVICKAVLSAVDALPDEFTTALKSNPKTAKTWEWFLDNMKDFKAGVASYDSDETPSICDCLQHEELSPHLRSSEGSSSSNSAVDDYSLKECSGCRTVAYCSPECQRQDWEAIHKFECSRSRSQRFELHNKGLRMTHRARMFYLRNLESNVATLSGMDLPHEHENCCHAPKKNRAYFLDARDMPMQVSLVEADVILDWVATDEGEPEAVPLSHDARFKAIIDQSYRDEDIHVACSIASIGDYLVITMGRFIFYGSDSESGSSESGGGEACEVEFLGGVVKIAKQRAEST